MSDEEFERDLDAAGAAMSAFAPGGWWGLAVGGALAAVALGTGALKRLWRRHRLG
ncbi:MAG: hypothetical protein M3345_04000 [Actinomycetota bacterium]|nr:hypothetical protein [Actinomycetota bacterium]